MRVQIFGARLENARISKGEPTQNGAAWLADFGKEVHGFRVPTSRKLDAECITDFVCRGPGDGGADVAHGDNLQGCRILCDSTEFVDVIKEKCAVVARILVALERARDMERASRRR